MKKEDGVIIEVKDEDILKSLSKNPQKFWKGVSCIGDNAFANCYELKRIVIPKTIKKIGDFAFAQCQDLKEVIIEEGVEEIGEYAFFHCQSLQRAEIPASVKAVKEGTFGGCHALRSVLVPSGVEIAETAFADCEKNLKIGYFDVDDKENE